MAIAGIDVGTTGSKITVYDEGGKRLYASYRDYPVSRNLGVHEIDARHIRDAVFALLSDAAGAVPALQAVGIATFGESFVLVGEDEEPLGPVMLYTDPRGEEETRELSAALGEDWLCRVTGAAPHSMYSAPKLLWVKKHRPDLFARVRYVFLIEDYVTWLLAGERVIDCSMAARTMALDTDLLDWSEAVLNAIGVPTQWMSRVVPTGTVAGGIRAELAGRLGVSPALTVVACCHDQVAAAVGSGVLQPGRATDGAGTVQCMTPAFAGRPEGHAMQRNNFVLIPFLQKDQFVTYAFQFTGGALIQWFVDTLAGYAKAEAEQKGVSVHDELEAHMGDGPTGILVLPHFAGAATPYMDTGSKGGIVGLTLEHSAFDLYRAMMEGVCYEMALNRERLRESGIAIDGLYATGGGARSKAWLQMKADVLGIPVHRMACDEAGTEGSIMLTGVACGVYPSLEAAARTFVSIERTYEPRAAQHAAYAQLYEKYRGLYAAIRPLV